MKIHYFQRYHEKENVSTANTMLLLSRLYSYSSDKFFRFLKYEFFSNSFAPELVFVTQEKSVKSIPDATITQEGFKIVVETKLKEPFDEEQLKNHLLAFGEHKKKVMITLAPVPMAKDKKEEFEKVLKEYNATQKYPVVHINTTFELLANAIQDVIDDRDYEMQEVLDDYLSYCYNDGLIPNHDAWKFMRMQLAGTTFDFNLSENVYYDKAERGFRAHDYLGLYKNKSVRAIGKVCARISAVEINGEIVFKEEYGKLTEERKQTIMKAVEDGYSHGYDLRSIETRYFFVEKFVEMDYKKDTPRAPMGTRIFDLSQILNINKMPEVEEIAKNLNSKTWS